VARDAAFQFYYPENLDLLREAGAELVFWSPLDDPVPLDADGLYLGGGYPELHGARLSANRAARDGVRKMAEAARPIYAECGGLMYLAEALEDLEGRGHEMVGLLPTTVRMRPRRLTLGYTEVELAVPSILGSAGLTARGHEFHYSTSDPVPDGVERTWSIRRPGGGTRAEGYRIGSMLATYVHLHWGSNPAFAASFVEACRTARG